MHSRVFFCSHEASFISTGAEGVRASGVVHAKMIVALTKHMNDATSCLCSRHDIYGIISVEVNHVTLRVHSGSLFWLHFPLWPLGGTNKQVTRGVGVVLTSLKGRRCKLTEALNTK